MNNVIITSGGDYLDIDGYAGIIAYATLLKAQGVPAYAVSPLPINSSVPKVIKQINLSLDDCQPTATDQFIILDASEPKFFPSYAKLSQIIEVIDHHTGFEDYWRQQTAKVQIEFIGSTSTMIYEKFVAANLTALLTPDLCKLLVSGIIDNTLNLKASITTDRDISAYQALLKLGNLTKGWAKTYLISCEAEAIQDLAAAIKNDIKTLDIALLPSAFAQLTVNSGSKFLAQIDRIKQIFAGHEAWAINLISLEDGRSYIVSNSLAAKPNLEKLLSASFKGDILTLDQFMLRKEIIKRALEFHRHASS